ncbi:MAG: Hsp70 family protein, partial [Candidatus Scalinduaceae bacterium]
AKDLGTGKEQSIQIKSSSGLSEAEIKKMQTEAEQHSEEDKKKRELIDARNQADQAIYSTEKTLKEQGDKISETEKSNINLVIEKLKKIKDGDDANEIKKVIDELQSASHKLAQAMYEDASKKEQATGKKAEEKPSEKEPKKDKEGEDVIDADYEVKD